MARLRALETKPRRLTRLVPAAVLVMVIVAGGAFLAGRLTGRPGGLSRTVIVEFRVEMPEVQSVHLVGDFNGWDTAAHPLSDPDGDGIWVTRVRLLPGSEYRYQFHVDGSRWMADPASDFQIEDGYGGKTSVLQI
jgi:1,4-alpha-glucan branching enzyme